MYVDKLVRACGMGSIDNYPRPPKVLQCTELNVVPATSCNSNSNIICTQWPDRDNNMCNGGDIIKIKIIEFYIQLVHPFQEIMEVRFIHLLNLT
jgi:hypothetical protein